MSANNNNGDAHGDGTGSEAARSKPRGKGRHRRRRGYRGDRSASPAYGALDLGTNNCRLLVARPASRGFRVIDAFSRIVRLGEGLSQSRCLSEAAMGRTIEALKICTEKLARSNVKSSRLIATEACRRAYNAPEFIDRVYRETGLKLEVIDRETEARLAVAGSVSLIAPESARSLIFDIGGGSSELMWLARADNVFELEHWMSLPIGVVTLAEEFDGRNVTPASFQAMKDSVQPYLDKFAEKIGTNESLVAHGGHMLGTSGTVTTLAGISMGLAHYDRKKVDGAWLRDTAISTVTSNLLAASYDERVALPCIGEERADLVLAGCAILGAIIDKWPCSRVRVADRGLREGILASLMLKDGYDCNDSRAPKLHQSTTDLSREQS